MYSHRYLYYIYIQDGIISPLCRSYGPTRAGQAACALLHTMWKYTDLHGAYKKVSVLDVVWVSSV